MPKFGYDWQDKDTVHWSTRHMPLVLLKRLQVLSARMGHSREFVLNQALDIGLSQLERAVANQGRN